MSRCRLCQVLPVPGFFYFPEQINDKIIGLVTGWSQLDFEESAGWMSKECGLVKRLVYPFMSVSVLSNEFAQ